jgi:predicted secreted protein
MAVTKGNDGVVKVDDVGQPGGTFTVAEIKSWSVEESADTLEVTTMGGSARTYKSSLTGWTGSIDVLWDNDYDDGDTIAIGRQILIDFYPVDSPTGAVYGGTCTVTGVTVTGSFDGLVEASITVQGTGSLFIS